MVLTEISIIHHVVIVLLLLWLLNSYYCCPPLAYFASLIYLYQVNDRYNMRLRRKLHFEEKKAANQKRILTDSETVRWLNMAVEKMWPICMEQIISQRIFLPIIPWFLQKYKPWTVKRAAVQNLYLGRTPPLFTDMRVLHESADDDHLVLELGLNFLTADDMSAIIIAKLRKRLGFGIVAKMHLTGMHVEGKVLVGVKFLRSWPFIGRLRVCFAEPPYFQMTVKPIFPHGLDVTEIPGIAGWLDNLLGIAFEETLVEPNMLVVDLEKFVSPQPENWFSVDVKETVAHVNVEVIEATELKPSDLNGLADPYVKGRLGPYRFKTQIQKKTLTPKWLEEFKVPICSWDSQNLLEVEVRDKDRFVDDILGRCSINTSELKDGQRHDMWLPLENVKLGRVHLAITVDVKGKERKKTGEEGKTEGERPVPLQCKIADSGPFPTSQMNKLQKIADTFEAIDVEGQKETGIWVHHPGSETSQAWEPRRGRRRNVDAEILSADPSNSSKQSSLRDDSSSDDESKEDGQAKQGNIIYRGFRTLFHRHSKKEDQSSSFTDSAPSAHANLKPASVKRVGVKLVMGDAVSEPIPVSAADLRGVSRKEANGAENLDKDDMLGNERTSASLLKQKLSKEGSPEILVNSEEGIPPEFDSSDDESSLSSSFHDSSAGGIPISSSFISRAAVANDDVEPDEQVHAVPSVPVEISEEPSKGTLDGSAGQNVVMINSTEANGGASIDESLKH